MDREKALRELIQRTHKEAATFRHPPLLFVEDVLAILDVEYPEKGNDD